MTTHLVTCGTSILSNTDFRALVAPNADHEDRNLTAFFGVDQCDWANLASLSTWRAKLANKLVGVTASLADCTSYSSELSSLHAPPHSMKPGDRVALLTSDTPTRVGDLAGEVLAHLLCRARNAPPATRANRPIDIREWAELPVVSIARQPGLDPSTPAAFGTGVASIAETLAAIHDRTPDDRWVAHLSGGFKAAIPSLIVLLQAFRSVRRDIVAQIVFEPKAGAEPSAVDVPIVAFQRASLDRALRDENADTVFGNLFFTQDRNPTAVGTALKGVLPPPRNDPDEGRSVG